MMKYAATAPVNNISFIVSFYLLRNAYIAKYHYRSDQVLTHNLERKSDPK